MVFLVSASASCFNESNEVALIKAMLIKETDTFSFFKYSGFCLGSEIEHSVVSKCAR